MKLTLRYAIAFLLLCLLLQELHELAHLLVDRLSVHCGTRYFLFWQMCEGATKYAAAAILFAGPAINYIMMAIGFLLLSQQSTNKQKSIGFCLILACNPLQRLQALVFRGSDEISAVRELLRPAEPFKGAAVIAGIAIMLVFVLPSLYRAFRNINTGNRWLLMAGFLIIPFAVNYILQQLFAGEHSRQILVSKPASFLPSWLVLIDLLLLACFLPLLKQIGQLFSKFNS